MDLNKKLVTELDSTMNSFLHETKHNSDIEDEVRHQIERRFKKSKVNKDYVFPRKPTKVRVANRTKRLKTQSSTEMKMFLSGLGDASSRHQRVSSLRMLGSAKKPSRVKTNPKKVACGSSVSTLTSLTKVLFKSKRPAKSPLKANTPGIHF